MFGIFRDEDAKVVLRKIASTNGLELADMTIVREEVSATIFLMPRRESFSHHRRVPRMFFQYQLDNDKLRRTTLAHSLPIVPERGSFLVAANVPT